MTEKRVGEKEMGMVEMQIEVPEELYLRVVGHAIEARMPVEQMISLWVHEMAYELDSRRQHLERLIENEGQRGRAKPR
ncbi:MAG: hypothetical protein NXI32_16990 [bacterium]|nr:hypothetical protein [bacterium]